MNLKHRTRQMFADELEQMLKKIPLEKVRVTTLCKNCDTSPQLFYYYFHDKYELVAWIFLEDYWATLGNRPADYSVQSLQKIMTAMRKRRIFYKRALTDNSQNSIFSYIHKFNMTLSEKAYEALHHGEQLSQDQILFVKYHSYGTLGLFIEWLDEKNSITAEQWAKFQYERTPQFLKDALAIYEYSSDDIFE